MKRFVKFWKDVFAGWSEDKASIFAAALALFTILSLGPLLLLTVSVVGLVVGEEQVEQQIVENTEGVVGEQGASAIQDVLSNASDPGSGLVAAIIGFVILVIGVSGLFGNIQTALNTVFGVEPKKEGIKGVILRRLRLIGVLGGSLLLLLVLFIATAGLSAITGSLVESTGVQTLILAGNIIFSLIVFTLAFAFLFKVVPEAEIRWRDVWIGAAVTSVLFTIGKEVIAFYLSYANVGSSFGAAASVIVLAVFIYYSAMIFLLGAEFTKVFARRHGEVVPKKHAQPIQRSPIGQPAEPAEAAQGETPREDLDRRERRRRAA